MTDKHLTGPKGFAGWRDTHARVTGEAVPILQSVFATMWHNTTGENLFDECYFPHRAGAGDVRARAGGERRPGLAVGGDPRLCTWR